jgi:hypothetical protein
MLSRYFSFLDSKTKGEVDNDNVNARVRWMKLRYKTVSGYYS